MINLNEYFDGNVKSLGYHNGVGKSTIGVMNDGEYEFSTAAPEIMTVVEGELAVKLANETEFTTYRNGDQFQVVGNSKFIVKSVGQTAYCCQYL